MELKDIRNLVSAKNVKRTALGCLTLFLVGCGENKNQDMIEIDKEIAQAQESLDLLKRVYAATSSTRNMYQRKCDLFISDQASNNNKNVGWRQYQDSVILCEEDLAFLGLELEREECRIASLIAKRNKMKSR